MMYTLEGQVLIIIKPVKSVYLLWFEGLQWP